MSKFLYFAYGSNMLSCRLQERTPSAKPVSSAHLRGHRLTFHKVSKDGSGKCHIENTSNAEDSVIGVLFEIEIREKEVLDKAEGLGHGYREQSVDVVKADGTEVQAKTYVGTDLRPNLKPYCWYKSFVVYGAREHHFPIEYIQNLEAAEFLIDPDPVRKRKNEQIMDRS